MTKIHRFIGTYQLGRGTLRIDDRDLSHQMRSVLKLAPGEMVILGDGTGLEARCKILSYEPGAVLLEGVSVAHNTAELAGRTILYCAVLKADHFELAAEKATEVGVSEIVPIITSRTVKLNVRVDRVQKIVREAAELAGRGTVPIVHQVQSLDAALTQASHYDANFFFDPSGRSFAPAKGVTTAGVFVGPEGGWDEKELDMAQSAGLNIVSLGNLTLRAETAVIVSSYIVANSLK